MSFSLTAAARRAGRNGSARRLGVVPIDVVDQSETDEDQIEDQRRGSENDVPNGVLAQDVAERKRQNHNEQRPRRQLEDRPFSDDQKTRREEKGKHIGANRWSLRHIERIGSRLVEIKPDVW